MSKSSRLVTAVALLVVGAACGLYFQRPATAQDNPEPKAKEPAAAVTKWEYRVVIMEENNDRTDQAATEKTLNELGQQGFEIAFQTSTQRLIPQGPGNGHHSKPVVHYTLKRIKQ